jgi:DNA (cytosine-5)-methyltransferase 1
MRGAYYNEIDPKAAAWLRELIAQGLIADGDVDTRSIADVRPADVRGYTQAHWFAGIGGWSLALRMAGWPDSRPVWTGSCPCQRHSSAARGRKVADDLWPAFRSLIAASRPRVVFSEQVATAGAWFDGVCDDLEGLDYTIGAAVLPACSVGCDHARYRLFFVSYTDSHGESGGSVDGEASWMPRDLSHPGGVVPKDGLPDRVATLRGFGNAIVPAVASEFIQAYQEARQ